MKEEKVILKEERIDIGGVGFKLIKVRRRVFNEGFIEKIIIIINRKGGRWDWKEIGIEVKKRGRKESLNEEEIELVVNIEIERIGNEMMKEIDKKECEDDWKIGIGERRNIGGKILKEKIKWKKLKIESDEGILRIERIIKILKIREGIGDVLRKSNEKLKWIRDGRKRKNDK